MSLATFFKKNKVMLLDGATGSQLISRGLKAGECPELWNLTRKDDLKEVAAMYFNAGSDAVLTNTFGGSLIKLKNYGLEQQLYALNYEGVKNAIAVKPSGKFVIGSVGPSGAMLEPYGDANEEEVTRSFALQVKAMADAGADGFLLETFIDSNEVQCAINAIRQECDLPFIISMTYTKGADNYHTMMGTSIEEAVSMFEHSGAFAIGSNCGNGLGNMIEVGTRLRKASAAIRIMVKPNAGEPVMRDGQVNYSEDPSFFAQQAGKLLSFNPSFLGGCCGTTQEHIKALRKIIDVYQGL